MGQALRRATGRIGSSRVDTTPSPSSLSKPIERRPPAAPINHELVNPGGTSGTEGASRVNSDNVLEDRDPQYDIMLSKMVGRIRPKPGGKLEMGEASVVDKYKRPLPKLRTTNQDSSRYEERPAPPGTLNISQLRQIILLYEGKAEDHDGPMDIAQIAKRFRVDVTQIQKIVQFVASPPELNNNSKNEQQ
ncbi:hypothetical protein F511_17576 [Dorcoceras hygrometricum]|uniref:Uncharacterized protein n=1 Tax=Dorcoceras hygrometricum TaxID=472368 RepID=A0A2Z7ARB2_9LAMI|nr:hypothetical protein F511_17576 [Dorcoceras hygrometricum]